MKALKIVGWIGLGLAGIAALGLLIGVVVQLLWNWLVPPIFGLPEITYWQGVGIFILFKILFGGHHPHHKKNGAKHPGHRFADRVRDRLRCRWDEEDVPESETDASRSTTR